MSEPDGAAYELSRHELALREIHKMEAEDRRTWRLLQVALLAGLMGIAFVASGCTDRNLEKAPGLNYTGKVLMPSPYEIPSPVNAVGGIAYGIAAGPLVHKKGWSGISKELGSLSRKAYCIVTFGFWGGSRCSTGYYQARNR